ncbi:MAG: DinB family protein [Pirellulales bacterium]
MAARSGQAHIAWQLMHVGVTELIVATERLGPSKPHLHKDLWPRFRGGSVPSDDDVPSLDAITAILAEGRRELLDTLTRWTDDALDELPFEGSKFTLRGWLGLIPWHEGHHHGQAHLTLNLYNAAHAS